MSGSDDAEGARDGGELDAALTDKFGWTPYRLLAGVALFGCVVVLVCDVVMWFLVQGYDPLGQTISELAAGPHHRLQDTGIIVFVVGILALTTALILRGQSSKTAWAVRAAFFLLAADIAMIALWNEYGDGEAGGFVIHKYLVGLLYLLVPTLLWFGTSVPPTTDGQVKFAKVGKIAAIAWLALAPVFYVLPDSIDGAYERLLALVVVGAVAMAAWQLYRAPSEG